MKNTVILFMIAAALVMTSCAKKDSTFSLLAESNSFKQSTAYQPRKIDILWVMDNSGSMRTSQQNVASSFRSFIDRFMALQFDFHMAVTTTDAYKAITVGSTTAAKFRDGVDCISNNAANTACAVPGSHSGVFVMDRNTPNIDNVFITNITQGVLGDGDERAFQSIQAAIQNTTNINSGFRRDDAFLAVIMISDEDDFSWNGAAWLGDNYNDPRLIPVSNYVTLLDNYTHSTATTRNYSVSSIAVMDSACQTSLQTDGFTGRKISKRMKDLVVATGGTQTSLCGNFGNSMQLISDQILSNSTTFQLDRTPVVSSIIVKDDGVVVAQDATNGWTYDATTNTITFHGSSVPATGSAVTIDYDPTTVAQ